jgi:hypothetical protein
MMKQSKYLPARQPKISRRPLSDERTVLIRNTADGLGIHAIEIEPSDLHRDTFRIEFADCTGRKQTLFLPFSANRARVDQTLRTVSGRRLRAS